MEWDVAWRCACGANQVLPHGTNLERIGIDNLAIHPEGTPDSVAAAIDREFTPNVLGNFDCPTCGQRRPRTVIKRIDGAPDLLRIKISNVYPSGLRNNNFVQLTPELDLRRYQAVAEFPAPLKYKLKSVLCHGGRDILEGHWTATVCDSQQVNHINDSIVREKNQAYLRSNPHDGRQAIVLTYMRISTKDG